MFQTLTKSAVQYCNSETDRNIVCVLISLGNIFFVVINIATPKQMGIFSLCSLQRVHISLFVTFIF